MGGADLAKIVAWFDQGGAHKVPGDERAELCYQGSASPGLPTSCPTAGSPQKRPRAVAARAALEPRRENGSAGARLGYPG
jgi:hypothetical protein